MSEITEGTEIYYTGDAANAPATGRVTVIQGNVYWLKLTSEDGHTWEYAARASEFQPQPGRRFMTMQERNAEREAVMAQYRNR